ncbi:MAG: hypothetical protein IT167_32240 [Bryobacterales bacterium]|nr:hypothetical protein [Bryobacterales bacterium]
MEARNIAALRHLDAYRSNAFERIEVLQALAQFAGFDADDGVDLRIKAARPVKHVDTEDRLLHTVRVARQSLLNNVSQEPARAGGSRERRTDQDLFQLLPD